jgi:hypothetical protein
VKRHVQLVNPREDTAFVALVDDEAMTAADPEDLQRRLRRTHPDAVVRARGLSGEAVDVWYVYRDGGWTAASRA